MDQGKQVLMQEEEIQRTVSRMAHEIVEKNGGTESLALRIPSRQQLAGEELGRFTELRDRHLFLLSDEEFRVAQNPS